MMYIIFSNHVKQAIYIICYIMTRKDVTFIIDSFLFHF